MFANTSAEGSNGGSDMADRSNELPSMMSRHGQEEQAISPRTSKRNKDLPPMFWYMETGDWEKAVERIQRHPKEVKTWATLRTKSGLASPGPDNATTSATKRLALHHACFKLRGAGATPPAKDDIFVEVCRFILLLIKLYPEAAQKRESRHGCLPLHLASFASCAPREKEDESLGPLLGAISRPMSVTKRSASDNTNDTMQTNMSAVHAEETFAGTMGDNHLRRPDTNPNVSVSMKVGQTGFSAKREEMLVQVVNALLDAYPKASRVDSEGGRLPLHTACAGRATPRVVSTLITAYPAAARQRNKDGFLPLHLAAHWGVSHIAVAVQLLRIYPDATVGRNRWERTPLEEALCMAGENGRPHQAALVRALRKHPSWWTRPQADTMGTRNRRPLPPAGAPKSNTVVDIDESLPSNEDSTFDEQIRLHQRTQSLQFGDSGVYDDEMLSYDVGEEVEPPPSPPQTPNGLMKRLSPRQLLSKTKKVSMESMPDPLGVGVSLAHLIEKRLWKGVVARIRQEPLEAEQEMQVMTRGGFMASTGMSPLHYACERRPPLEVAQLLIDAFPFATLTRAMPGGCLPIHICCTWGGSHDVAKALLQADSGSVRVKDELGNVALHSACFSGADIRVVEALLRSDAKSVLARNHQGSRPIDISKRLRHENRVSVMALLNTKKEEIMRTHRRSRSSGLLAEIASEAVEINKRTDVPLDISTRDAEKHHDTQASGGVEVTYDQSGAAAEELHWI